MRHVTIYQAPPGRSAMYASLVEMGADELLCAFRTSTLDGSDPWTNLDDAIVCLRSTDAGETWGEPCFVSPGAYPCLLPRGEGEIMLAYYTDATHLQATFLRLIDTCKGVYG